MSPYRHGGTAIATYDDIQTQNSHTSISIECFTVEVDAIVSSRACLGPTDFDGGDARREPHAEYREKKDE